MWNLRSSTVKPLFHYCSPTYLPEQTTVSSGIRRTRTPSWVDSWWRSQLQYHDSAPICKTGDFRVLRWKWKDIGWGHYCSSNLMQKFGRVQSTTPVIYSKLVSTNHWLQPALLESIIGWNQLGVDAWHRLPSPKLLLVIWACIRPWFPTHLHCHCQTSPGFHRRIWALGSASPWAICPVPQELRQPDSADPRSPLRAVMPTENYAWCTLNPDHKSKAENML